MTGNLSNPAYPSFYKAVSDVARDSARGNERFPARNLLLDEGAAPNRSTRYLTQAESRIASVSWTELHADHLRAHVSHARDPRARDGLDSIAPCADTFTLEPDFSRYGAASQALSLVRCEEARTLSAIARRSGLRALADESRLINLLKAFVLDKTDPSAREDLQDILDIYAQFADARPIFAAFEDDLQEALTDTAMWQDHLRDALGLVHIKRGSFVVLLRYFVARIPKVHGAADSRALVVPTMLDTSLSNAFCPSPAQAATGHTVHLSPLSFNPCREVLHPWVKWRVDDVLRVAEIQTTPPAKLADARAFHLLALRELTKRSTYANDTDSDLLS